MEKRMDKQKRKSIGITVLVMVLIGVIAIGVFMTLTRDNSDPESKSFFGRIFSMFAKNSDESKLEADVDVSEYASLTQRDLTVNYPVTCREVVKYYCRITKCLYNDDLSDSQVEKLVDMLRLLYSDELLAENPRDDMVWLVKGDINTYKKAGRKINSYSIDDSGDIVYIRTTNPAKASVNIYFTIKEGNGFNRAFEEILLVETSENVWKILGWRESDDTSLKPSGD